MELGIPVAQLDDHLQFLKQEFPGARTIMFGYGKKTFITAPPETFSEYLLGPVPGPAVVQVTALSVLPPEAYPPGDTIALGLTPSGNVALSDYIWSDLTAGGTIDPRIVTHWHDPESLFYAAATGYNLLHTCNTWAADGLTAAGLPVSGANVIFSGQVMKRSMEAASGQCGQKPD